MMLEANFDGVVVFAIPRTVATISIRGRFAALAVIGDRPDAAIGLPSREASNFVQSWLLSQLRGAVVRSQLRLVQLCWALVRCSTSPGAMSMRFASQVATAGLSGAGW